MEISTFRGYYLHFVEISTFCGYYPHFVGIYVLRGYYPHFVEKSMSRRSYTHFVEISTSCGYYPHFVDIIYIYHITSYLARNAPPIFHIYSFSESDWCTLVSTVIFSSPQCEYITTNLYILIPSIHYYPPYLCHHEHNTSPKEIPIYH